MWAVLYDDGMSLTTTSERIAHSLAEAERQRGHRVTVRRLDDAETHLRGAAKSARPPGGVRGAGPVRPEPEPIRPAERFARPQPISEPEPAPAPEPEPPETLEPTRIPEQPEPPPASEPASEGRPPELAPVTELTQVLGPTQAAEPAPSAQPASVPEPASEAARPALTRELEPARAAMPTTRRRLLLYALAAASIVVAAALVNHWGVLPRVGAHTNSGPTHVGGSPQRPQLLPPLDQPPVMHFSNAVNATSPLAEPSAQPTRPAAEQSGAQNSAVQPAGSRTFAERPPSAAGESSGGGPSTIARGG
jgi:hypothetical protein